MRDTDYRHSSNQKLYVFTEHLTIKFPSHPLHLVLRSQRLHSLPLPLSHKHTHTLSLSLYVSHTLSLSLSLSQNDMRQYLDFRTSKASKPRGYLHELLVYETLSY
jgi:hypothetical protein